MDHVYRLSYINSFTKEKKNWIIEWKFQIRLYIEFFKIIFKYKFKIILYLIINQWKKDNLLSNKQFLDSISEF